MRYYPMFPWAIPHPGIDHLRVTHPFATLPQAEARVPVRLACLRRAASVSSEPGSNSPSYYTSLPHLRREASLLCFVFKPSPLVQNGSSPFCRTPSALRPPLRRSLPAEKGTCTARQSPPPPIPFETARARKPLDRRTLSRTRQSPSPSLSKTTLPYRHRSDARTAHAVPSFQRSATQRPRRYSPRRRSRTLQRQGRIYCTPLRPVKYVVAIGRTTWLFRYARNTYRIPFLLRAHLTPGYA
jgi:hypothetical protein